MRGKTKTDSKAAATTLTEISRTRHRIRHALCHQRVHLESTSCTIGIRSFARLDGELSTPQSKACTISHVNSNSMLDKLIVRSMPVAAHITPSNRPNCRAFQLFISRKIQYSSLALALATKAHKQWMEYLDCMQILSTSRHCRSPRVHESSIAIDAAISARSPPPPSHDNPS